MLPSKKVLGICKQEAIRINRNAAMDLPPSVRELADLLAEIAVKQLNPPNQPSQTGLDKKT